MHILLTGQYLHADLDGVGCTLPSRAPLATPNATESRWAIHALKGSLLGLVDSSGNLCNLLVRDVVVPTDSDSNSDRWLAEGSTRCSVEWPIVEIPAPTTKSPGWLISHDLE